MKVQKLVAWEVNRLQKTAHLTHRVPSQGGRRPDGQQSLPYRLEDTNRTGPVYTHRGGGLVWALRDAFWMRRVFSSTVYTHCLNCFSPFRVTGRSPWMSCQFIAGLSEHLVPCSGVPGQCSGPLSSAINRSC